MAMTAAERMAALRIRKAIEAARFEKQTLAEAYSTPFADWLDGPGTLMNVALPLDNAGIPCPAFNDDSGGQSLSGQFEQALKDADQLDLLPENSLQRAELIVESWLDAAMELASEINAYKRHHLSAGLDQIERQGAQDEKTSEKAALLRRLLESLSKDVRRALPNWKPSAT